jgi:hypothetical protein
MPCDVLSGGIELDAGFSPSASNAISRYGGTNSVAKAPAAKADTSSIWRNQDGWEQQLITTSPYFGFGYRKQHAD